MSDEGMAIALVQRTGHDALSVDQLMLLHLSGALPALPAERITVLIVGSVPPYSDEPATFHPALAHELVRRGVAAYA
jgi:hypothetical protein